MKLVHLLIFSLLYLLVLICSLSICAGIIVIQEEFSEGCGLHVMVASWSSIPRIAYTTTIDISACMYVIYMPIAVAHITFYLFVYHVYPAITIIAGNKPSYNIWSKSCFTLSILLAFAMFLGCLDITKGFNTTCKQLRSINELTQKSCEESFSLVVWRRKKDGGIYSMLLLAEASSWAAFSILVGIILLWCHLIFFKKNMSFFSYSRQYSISTSVDMRLLFFFVFAFLYLVVGICCLLITISIGVLKGKFTDKCGLFIEVTKHDNGVVSFTYTSSTSVKTCDVLIGMPIVVFVVSIILVVYHLYPAILILRKREVSYEVGIFVCLCVTIVTGLVLFIESCIISAGFNKTCSQVASINKVYKDFSCRTMLSFINFNYMPVDYTIPIFLSLAEMSSWVAFLTTAVLITISSFLIFCKQCQDRPSQGSSISTNKPWESGFVSPGPI